MPLILAGIVGLAVVATGAFLLVGLVVLDIAMGNLDAAEVQE